MSTDTAPKITDFDESTPQDNREELIRISIYQEQFFELRKMQKDFVNAGREIALRDILKDIMETAENAWDDHKENDKLREEVRKLKAQLPKVVPRTMKQIEVSNKLYATLEVFQRMMRAKSASEVISRLISEGLNYDVPLD